MKKLMDRIDKLTKYVKFDINDYLEPQCEEIASPFHVWGDGFDFSRLDKAGSYIADYVYQYSRCRLSWKEKYGTLRYEFLTPPRWCWYIFNCWIYFQWIKLGRIVLTRAIKKAIIKFPDMKEEILDDVWWEK